MQRRGEGKRVPVREGRPINLLPVKIKPASFSVLENAAEMAEVMSKGGTGASLVTVIRSDSLPIKALYEQVGS